MFSKILVPVDISHIESGEVAVKAAKKIAGTKDASLAMMTVIADMPNLVAAQLPSDFDSKAVGEASARLAEVAASCGVKLGDEGLIVRHGSPYHEILEQAKKMNADLIVVASHRPELSDYLLGSVAARVVRHADCSVLVVRA